MSRSVPDNDVMETQQEADRKVAGKATKGKRKPKAKAAAPATKTVKTRRDGAKRTTRTKSAPGKAVPDRAHEAQAANREMRAQSRATEKPAKAIESDVRANRGLGRLFSFFRRSRGERKLEEAADAALGRKK